MFSSFLNVAHRGYHKQFPENSLEAFVAARELGVNMIEFDVQMSLDRELWLVHDKVNWSQENAAPQKFCSLAKLFDTLGAEIFYYLEIKHYPQAMSAEYVQQMLERIVQVVKEYGLQENVLHVSFNIDMLKRLHQMEPGLNLGLNLKNELLISDQVDSSWIQALCPCQTLVSQEFVQNYRKQGFHIVPFTVNDVQQMKTFKSYGVSGITSDEPQSLLLLS